MDDMPILPKLVGKPAAAAPGAAPPAEEEPEAVAPITFDELTPDQVEALVAEASSGAALGEDAEQELSFPDGIEPTEEQLGMLEARKVQTIAEAFENDCFSGVNELQSMLAQVEAAEDGDPKAMQKLIDAATKEHEACTKALEKVGAAVEKGDAKKAAELAQACEEASGEIQSLLGEGRALVARQKPAAPVGPDGKPQAKMSPLATWING